MSAESPPIYYFTNINFNSSFYDPANTGLTQTQANALYLRKTTPDTASAIETFAGGVLTDTIDSITSGSNMAIASNHTSADLFLGQNLTSGNIYIGVDASATTGRSGTIHIGDGNNIATASPVHINNGTTNASNTNINNGTSTSGTVNIMTGNTSSGIINLATGSGSAKVNIGNGTSSGAITIGNTTNVVTIGSSALSLGSTTKILTVNAPITTNYLTSAITSNTQIGFKMPESVTAPIPPLTIPSTIASNLANVSLLRGIWLLQGNVKFNTPGTQLSLAIAGSIGSFDFDAQTTTAGISNSIAQVSRIVNVGSGTPTWYLTGGCQTATVVTNVIFNAYRLA